MSFEVTKINLVNSLNKEEKFSITLTDKDRIIDLRKEVQHKSAYFSSLSYNRIGFFIYLPQELASSLNAEESSKKKVKRDINKNNFDIKDKYPIKTKLSYKNDFKIFDSYPYIKENSDKIILYIFDIGMQIETPLANFIEYSGPIFILIFYYYYYKNSIKKYNFTQIWTMTLISIHYFKRVIESLFVHIQINTMEMKMFLVECVYYIIYFGIYSQRKIFTNLNYSDNENKNENIFQIKSIFIILFFICESNNFYCHVILRKIRLNNCNKREIPYGNLFKYVYCANYFWEISSWICISVFSGLKAIYFFTFMGAVIMSFWALEKKKLYQKMMIKQFGEDLFPDTKAIIPFVL